MKKCESVIENQTDPKSKLLSLPKPQTIRDAVITVF